MEIKQIQAIEGANVYSHRPIIRVYLDLQEYTERLTSELGDFSSRLVEILPTLAEHCCSRGKPGGFVERLKEGTLLGHVIEHVTIDLLNQAGQTVKYGKTMGTEKPGLYEIIFNYEYSQGAIEAFYQAFDLVTNVLHGKPFNVSDAVKRIKEVTDRERLGPSTQVIVDACKERGIPVQRLNNGSLLQIGYGRNQRRIQAAMTSKTSCIGVDIACDKEMTKKILKESGIAVPDGCIVYTEEEAVQAFEDIGAPVAIKPLRGNQGKGVTLNITTPVEVRQAFRVAQVYGDAVIVEEYIEGQQYRLLVVGDKLIAAAKRLPAHVVGDGTSTIRELIDRMNQDQRRGEGHEKALTKIKVDSVVILTLAQKNMTLDSVPKAGETVYLRQGANLSTGGIAEDVTDEVHPDNADLAVYATKVIGLDVAGVDMVIPNISISYREKRGYIIEINAAPGIRMHHFPSLGKPRDVGKAIVDHILPSGNGRIPIVSITGTNGKTTTTRMIAKMLLDQRLQVGMTSTDGIYVNGNLLVKGDTTGPESARIVLRHPDVQVAVLETARGGILRAGLGYDYADVAVITNVSNDHLGQYGVETLDDIAHVKSLVAEVVKPYSYVVLNADDHHVRQMAGRTPGRVILFSTEKDNIYVRKHLAKGGVAVFVRRGMILLCQGDHSYRITALKNVPVTWNGKAHHNIENTLAAVAAGWALGLSTEAIRKSLATFTSDAVNNRGRMNLYNIGGVQVCVDYGHNPAGIAKIIQALRKFKAKALVAGITVPGDRPDDTIREVARVAAKGFDRLVIHEDDDLRGRKRGEIAEIIRSEAIASGLKEENISVVLPQREAFKYGLATCQPGELFVMFYEKLEPIEEEIHLQLAQQQKNDEKEQGNGVLVAGGEA